AFDADIADYQGFFDGKSMGELRDAGINTKLVKSAKVRRQEHHNRDGSYTVTETREIVLQDRMAALGHLKGLVSEKVAIEDDEVAETLVEAVLERFHKSRTRPQLPGARAPRFPGIIDVEVMDDGSEERTERRREVRPADDDDAAGQGRG
ncbi:hypothetical protein LCGC14_2499900, partial [marine sediment metagenome]